MEERDFTSQCTQMVKDLWHTYLLKGRPEEFQRLFSQMTQRFVLIGTGKHEFYEGLGSVLSALVPDQESVEDVAFEIVDEWYAVQEITPDVCIVYGTFWAREQPQQDKRLIADMDTRFSVVCRREADGRVTLCHMHHSVPNIDQQIGEYYPKSITERANEAIQKYELLENRVRRDSLTDLYNRAYMEDYVSERLKQRPDCVFYMIDIDNFKLVNDQLGHLQGDLVLKRIAELLLDIFGPEPLVSRIGGDEFAVFLEGPQSEEEAARKAHQFITRFNQYNQKGLKLGKVSCSVGISCAPEDGLDFNTLYAKADQALYHIKNNKKGAFAFYRRL